MTSGFVTQTQEQRRKSLGVAWWEIYRTKSRMKLFGILIEILSKFRDENLSYKIESQWHLGGWGLK